MKRQETIRELEQQEAEAIRESERQEAEASFSFRKGTKVILQGLIKTPQLNGTKGVVISEFSKGRYPVSIEGLGDFRIKRSNLRNEVSVESLSIKELKTILAYKKEQKSIASATENSELQAKVLEFITSSEELPELLANARSSKKHYGYQCQVWQAWLRFHHR